MNQINQTLEQMGVVAAPEPRRDRVRQRSMKIAGESKTARRMRRLAERRLSRVSVVTQLEDA